MMVSPLVSSFNMISKFRARLLLKALISSHCFHAIAFYPNPTPSRLSRTVIPKYYSAEVMEQPSPTRPPPSVSSLESDSSIDTQRWRIFCNRALTLSKIEAIGFDMDFTLARYKTEFDLLSYEGAKVKLRNMGYPEEVLHFEYDPNKFTRGLVLDKRRGNILKLDRFDYVMVAQHGSRLLSKEERHSIYRDSVNLQPSFGDEKLYLNLDTQFHLIDAALFEQLVDLKDQLDQQTTQPLNQDKSIPHKLSSSELQYTFIKNKTYAELALDVRSCVDLCHQDGVIKNSVMKNPGLYIHDDPELFSMLTKLKKSNKKVFLLTNSLFDYTNSVMTYLHKRYLELNQHLESTSESTETPESLDTSTKDATHDNKSKEHAAKQWMDYFDVVMVGACKPSFMHDDDRSLFLVIDHSPQPQLSNQPRISTTTKNNIERSSNAYCLQNCNISDILPTLRSSNSVCLHDKSSSSEPGGGKSMAFQGGSWPHLHRLLNISSGEQLLYVGDHMYSDIVKGKRKLGWRTCLLIPELDHVLKKEDDPAVVEMWEHILNLRSTQCELDEKIDLLETSPGVKLRMRRDVLAIQQVALRQELGDSVSSYHSHFHPRWGNIFKAGVVGSRFAKQVSDYACIYTTQPSVLGTVSMKRGFRPMSDVMPHNNRGSVV